MARISFAGSDGNASPDDQVLRAHLWDVPLLPSGPDTVTIPGLYFDSSHNIAGIGNTVVEVFTLPGVVLQRITGIDSGKIASRRLYGGSWSSWVVQTA
jgi:hypothetical protein